MSLPLCCPRCGSHVVNHVSYHDAPGAEAALAGGEWCCQECGDTCENPMAAIAASPGFDIAVGATVLATLVSSMLLLVAMGMSVS